MQTATALSRTVVKFPPHSDLRAALTEQVEGYLKRNGLSAQGGARMAWKSACVVAWWLASYLLLVFWAASWWQAILAAISLSLSVAAVGFNIQHDGGHGAYSKRKLGNRISALALDLVGGSSYIWHFKHNVLHHHGTNVEGVDDDLDPGPLLRFAETQPRRWIHRYQHYYIWFLYMFLPIKWQWFDDFRNLSFGSVGGQPFPRPKGWNLVALLAGKVVFFGWALVLPLLLHPVGSVLALYAFCCLVTGVTLGTVFQLAHCVEEAAHCTVPAAREKLSRPWAEHQLATTVDFAPRNRWLGWYLGGLNLQVEHHLFPGISHLHYPALAPIVRSVCAEHGIRHLSHDTMFSALRSHGRFLRRIGRGE
jgi:linoleoyl-CoA desaturase